jgi:hypothetical protein
VSDWRTKDDQELTKEDIREMRAAALTVLPARIVEVQREVIEQRNTAVAEVERLREAIDTAISLLTGDEGDGAYHHLIDTLAGAAPEGDPPTDVRGFCVCDGDGPKLDCGNPEHRSAARSVAAVVQATPEPTKTAAELIREVAAADPEAHARALGRAYGVGPTDKDQCDAFQPHERHQWMYFGDLRNCRDRP